MEYLPNYSQWSQDPSFTEGKTKAGLKVTKQQGWKYNLDILMTQSSVLTPNPFSDPIFLIIL